VKEQEITLEETLFTQEQEDLPELEPTTTQFTNFLSTDVALTNIETIVRYTEIMVTTSKFFCSKTLLFGIEGALAEFQTAFKNLNIDPKNREIGKIYGQLLIAKNFLIHNDRQFFKNNYQTIDSTISFFAQAFSSRKRVVDGEIPLHKSNYLQIIEAANLSVQNTEGKTLKRLIEHNKLEVVKTCAGSIYLPRKKIIIGIEAMVDLFMEFTQEYIRENKVQDTLVERDRAVTSFLTKEIQSLEEKYEYYSIFSDEYVVALEKYLGLLASKSDKPALKHARQEAKDMFAIQYGIQLGARNPEIAHAIQLQLLRNPDLAERYNMASITTQNIFCTTYMEEGIDEYTPIHLPIEPYCRLVSGNLTTH